MAERIFLGLGSNLGDRGAYLRRALACLAETSGVQLVARASLYRTEPVGPVAQPWFLNTVVELASELSPPALLRRCQQIEFRLGRVSRQAWGPREIDLDLLFYGERVVSEPGLQIPHPQLARRRFVLVPLAELAPRLWHPLAAQTVASLLAGLVDDKGVMSYQEGDLNRRPLAGQAGGNPGGRSVSGDILRGPWASAAGRQYLSRGHQRCPQWNELGLR